MFALLLACLLGTVAGIPAVPPEGSGILTMASPQEARSPSAPSGQAPASHTIRNLQDQHRQAGAGDLEEFRGGGLGLILLIAVIVVVVVLLIIIL